MTGKIGNDVAQQPQTKTTYNLKAGVQAGYKQVGYDRALIFGPKAEAGFERNGWHGNVGLGAGTALTADIELGKEFNFNKYLGLDLSATASNTTSLLDKNSSIHQYSLPDGTEHVDERTWRSNITEAGAKAMLNIKPSDKVTVGIGASGQYVRNNAPNHTSHVTYETATYTTTSSAHYEGFRVSPEIALSVQAGKNITIGANVNSRGGGVNVVYNF